MTKDRGATNHRILAVYPFRRGFGFAVLEPGRLVDWGIGRLYSMNDDEFLVRAEGMLERYRAGVLAVEDAGNERRGTLAMRRIERLIGFATRRRILAIPVSRAEVRRVLALQEIAPGHEVAVRLTELFPELLPLLPAKRRFYESEDDRMNIFRAVGFACAARCA